MTSRWPRTQARGSVLLSTLLLGLCIVLGVPRVVAAPAYTVSDIGSLGYVTRVIDINEHGQVLLTAYDESGFSRHYLWRDGTATQLDVPDGFSNSDVSGMNDLGQVVGLLDFDVPVIWDNGNIIRLERPAGGEVKVGAINNRGQVAGMHNGSLVIWQNGVITYRSAYLVSFVTAINERGQVVGQLFDVVTDQYRAFAWNNGTFTVMPHSPGMIWSYATDINENGQIVGEMKDGGEWADPALWQNGTATLLPLPPDCDAGLVSQINDRGQIVGGVADSSLIDGVEENNPSVGPSTCGGVLWQNGGVLRLDPFKGDTGSRPWAINNRGQIAGDSGGGTAFPQGHAVLWRANPNAKILANPGFESDADKDGTPDEWSASIHAARSAEAKRSGSAGLRLQSTSNSDFRIYQPVYGLRANAGYDVGGWVNVARTSDSFKVTLAIAWKDNTGRELRVDPIKSWSGPTGGWNQGTKRLVSPAGTEHAVIRLNVSSLAATVYIDDIVFKPR